MGLFVIRLCRDFWQISQLLFDIPAVSLIVRSSIAGTASTPIDKSGLLPGYGSLLDASRLPRLALTRRPARPQSSPRAARCRASAFGGAVTSSRFITFTTMTLQPRYSHSARTLSRDHRRM